MTDLIETTIAATLAQQPAATLDLEVPAAHAPYSYGVHEAQARSAAASTSPEDLARARAVIARGQLQRYLDDRVPAARATVERIFREVPQDAIAPLPALAFAAGHHRGTPAAVVTLGELGDRPIHRHALGQLAERLGVPSRYLLDLVAGSGTEAWKGDLLGRVMTDHATHRDERALVRMVGGEVRGVLSDRYRRLDSRPLLEALVSEGERAGLVLADGVASDVRVSVRMVHPEVIDLPGGDQAVLGLSFQNSDFGAGAHEVSAYLLRLACLNGATMQNTLRAVHLGRRISDDAILSQQTADLDTATMASAIRDVVRAMTAGGTLRDRLVEQVRTAEAQRVTGDPVKGGLRSALSVTEQKRVRELFSGPEVVMLPPEPTRWRLSNVFSWMANEADAGGDPDRRLELERLAGEMLDTTRARDLVRREVAATA